MKLSPEDAEETARVIEYLFKDLEDLRALRDDLDWSGLPEPHAGTLTDIPVARVKLLNLLSAATYGDLTEEDARTLYLSLHTNNHTGHERGDCHCDHCDNAVGELTLYLHVVKPESGVYSPASLVRREAEKRGWE